MFTVSPPTPTKRYNPLSLIFDVQSLVNEGQQKKDTSLKSKGVDDQKVVGKSIGTDDEKNNERIKTKTNRNEKWNPLFSDDESEQNEIEMLSVDPRNHELKILLSSPKRSDDCLAPIPPEIGCDAKTAMPVWKTSSFTDLIGNSCYEEENVVDEVTIFGERSDYDDDDGNKSCKETPDSPRPGFVLPPLPLTTKKVSFKRLSERSSERIPERLPERSSERLSEKDSRNDETKEFFVARHEISDEAVQPKEICREGNVDGTDGTDGTDGADGRILLSPISPPKQLGTLEDTQPSKEGDMGTQKQPDSCSKNQKEDRNEAENEKKKEKGKKKEKDVTSTTKKDRGVVMEETVDKRNETPKFSPSTTTFNRFANDRGSSISNVGLNANSARSYSSSLPRLLTRSLDTLSTEKTKVGLGRPITFPFLENNKHPLEKEDQRRQNNKRQKREQRREKEVCLAYMKGRCRLGNKCPRSHTTGPPTFCPPPASNPCLYIINPEETIVGVIDDKTDSLSADDESEDSEDPEDSKDSKDLEESEKNGKNGGNENEKDQSDEKNEKNEKRERREKNGKMVCGFRTKRDRGFCYCGSNLRLLSWETRGHRRRMGSPTKSENHEQMEEERPWRAFSTVCARTGRSMKLCRGAGRFAVN